MFLGCKEHNWPGSIENKIYLIRFGQTMVLLFKWDILAKMSVLGNLTHICRAWDYVHVGFWTGHFWSWRYEITRNQTNKQYMTISEKKSLTFVWPFLSTVLITLTIPSLTSHQVLKNCTTAAFFLTRRRGWIHRLDCLEDVLRCQGCCIFLLHKLVQSVLQASFIRHSVLL